MDDLVTYVEGSPLRIVRGEYGSIFRRAGFYAYVDRIKVEGTEWADTPKEIIGKGRTIAEAQSNFWSRWLIYTIKNGIQNPYLTLEQGEVDALDS